MCGFGRVWAGSVGVRVSAIPQLDGHPDPWAEKFGQHLPAGVAKGEGDGPVAVAWSGRLYGNMGQFGQFWEQHRGHNLICVSRILVSCQESKQERYVKSIQ